MTLADELRQVQVALSNLRQRFDLGSNTLSIVSEKDIEVADRAIGLLPSLITRIEALEGRAEWQPIETAPMNTTIDVGAYIDDRYYRNCGVKISSKKENAMVCAFLRIIPAQYWRSLPAAPKHAHIIPKEDGDGN